MEIICVSPKSRFHALQVIYCDEMYILLDEQMEGQDLYTAFYVLHRIPDGKG
jgi:hypothetical protein